jgi:hypothetical protein
MIHLFIAGQGPELRPTGEDYELKVFVIMTFNPPFSLGIPKPNSL